LSVLVCGFVIWLR